VAHYHREGFLAPVHVMSPADMASRLRWLEQLESERAGRLAPTHNIKAHLLVPWLWQMVHDPAILDPVEDLLGPDLLCWAAGFFDKRPGEPHHVTWHQDASYWGLSAPDALTAWIAFTPSRQDNGCLRVSARTHGGVLPHINTQDRTNMLPGREAVALDIDAESAVDIVLEPGEMSLHHVLTVHGSEANRSGERRCGLAIRYIAGHLTKLNGARGTATLVRGRDHGHFDLETAPEDTFHPDALARYATIVRSWMRGVFDEMSPRAPPPVPPP
jgi:ectoine hydroxylase-related dioxygenase (phytanoyl-CoA dioxygenase family)